MSSHTHNMPEPHEGTCLLQDWEEHSEHYFLAQELDESCISEQSQEECADGLDQKQLWRLYTSHFLSTWNTRCYEFAAILFTASAYPDTLLPASLRGILANASALCLSSSIGYWIDTHPSRLRPLQTTIVMQRLCILAACVGWIFIFAENLFPKNALLVAIILLGILERLCTVGNTFAMERDWVPTLASPSSKPSLHALNASMRRIDLISKIVAPIFISAITVRAKSVLTVAAIVAVQNAISTVPEWYSAKNVWLSCPKLRMARFAPAEADDHEANGDGQQSAAAPRLGQGLRLYFSSDVWIPSLSSALQSFPVLSLSGSMTTYLLARNYSLSLITVARTLSSFIEVSSTVIMPWAVSRLSSPRTNPIVPLFRVGVWGLSWEFINLLPPVSALLLLPAYSTTPASSHPFLTLTLFLFLALSRLGLWTHNLVVQNLVQIQVPAAHRVQFSGVEMAFMSAAEIGRWSCTAIWPYPEQFKGVAVAGMVVIAICWLSFILWVWRRQAML